MTLNVWGFYKYDIEILKYVKFSVFFSYDKISDLL